MTDELLELLNPQGAFRVSSELNYDKAPCLQLWVGVYDVSLERAKKLLPILTEDWIILESLTDSPTIINHHIEDNGRTRPDDSDDDEDWN